MAYYQTWDKWWASQDQQHDWFDQGKTAEDAYQYWVSNIATLPIEPLPPPPACEYIYSEWGPCRSDGTQIRTLLSQSPKGCVGTPILIQACSYAPPVEPPDPVIEPVPGMLPSTFMRIVVVDNVKYMGTFVWDGISYVMVNKAQWYRQKNPYQNVDARIYNPSELSTIIANAYGTKNIPMQNGQDYYYGIPFEKYEEALGQIQLLLDMADVAGGLPIGIQPWGSIGYGTRDCDDYAHFALSMLRYFWPGCAVAEVFGTVYNQSTAGHAWNLVVNDKGEIRQLDLTQVIGPPRPHEINPTNSVTWVYF